MARRKTRRPKKPTPAASSGISTRQYNLLKKEAGNARRRIGQFLKRGDAGNYFVPDARDYLLDTLLKRVQAGEKPKNIVRDLRNITAERILKSTAKPVKSELGYQLSKKEVNAVRSAVEQANSNIAKARAEFEFASDVLPNLKNADDIIRKAVDKDSITTQLDILSKYTTENLIPTAINEYGEAGTMAEVYETTTILNKENERRARLKAEIDAKRNEGYFVDQDSYESRPIKIEDIEGIDNLRKMAETWSDYGSVVRANVYLKNYEDSIDLLQSAMINMGIYNDTIEERFDYIKDVIGRLYNNEKAVSFIANRVPQAAIAIVSPVKDDPFGVAGEINFNEVYEAWIGIEESFL